MNQVLPPVIGHITLLSVLNFRYVLSGAVCSTVIYHAVGVLRDCVPGSSCSFKSSMDYPFKLPPVISKPFNSSGQILQSENDDFSRATISQLATEFTREELPLKKKETEVSSKTAHLYLFKLSKQYD